MVILDSRVEDKPDCSGGEGKKESSKQKKQHVCKLGGWHADFVVEREAEEEVY